MTTGASSALPTQTLADVRKPLPASRYFYTLAALVLLVLTFAGFHRYYLHGQAYPGRPVAPPMVKLVFAHGLSMSVWILLFILQPWLVVTKKLRLHMRLGYAGAVLAGVIVLLGLWTSVISARFTPTDVRIWGMAPKIFFAVPLISVGMFGVFVAVAVWKRKQPDAHRAMMLLGTLSAAGAAISRIDLFNNLYVGTALEPIFGPFLFVLVLGAIFLAIRSALIRALDRWLAFGLVTLTAAYLVMMQITTTAAWDRATDILLP